MQTLEDQLKLCWKHHLYQVLNNLTNKITIYFQRGIKELLLHYKTFKIIFH